MNSVEPRKKTVEKVSKTKTELMKVSKATIVKQGFTMYSLQLTLIYIDPCSETYRDSVFFDLHPLFALHPSRSVGCIGDRDFSNIFEFFGVKNAGEIVGSAVGLLVSGDYRDIIYDGKRFKGDKNNEKQG